jgi:hypothetical protein
VQNYQSLFWAQGYVSQKTFKRFFSAPIFCARLGV